MSAAASFAALDYADGDGEPWDVLAARAGIAAPQLGPGDEALDVLVTTALYWPVAHPALQERRRDPSAPARTLPRS